MRMEKEKLMDKSGSHNKAKTPFISSCSLDRQHADTCLDESRESLSNAIFLEKVTGLTTDCPINFPAQVHIYAENDLPFCSTAQFPSGRISLCACNFQPSQSNEKLLSFALLFITKTFDLH